MVLILKDVAPLAVSPQYCSGFFSIYIEIHLLVQVFL